MKIINLILRFLVGGLFIFSGLIKLNDPIGTTIKLEEYFEVFATDQNELYLSALSGFWHFLLPYSLNIAVFLSVLEVVLGIGLLINYKIKSTLWTLLFTIIFFTFLTFYSAYFNKVTDCGCFGDAIKLTPWQSFTKDIILSIFIGVLFYQRRNFYSSPAIYKMIISIGVTIFSFWIAITAINHLPFKDFRAYKVGADIPKSMKASAELKYEEMYIYTDLKTGEDVVLNSEEFNKNWKKYGNESKYKYKDYKKKLLNPEAQPKITDYNVVDRNGNDVTAKTFEGNKLLIIIPDVQKTNPSSIEKINSLVRALEKTEIKSMILTSEPEEKFQAFKHQFQLSGAKDYTVDKTVLKTMIRSNPGLIWIQDGIVKGKWHYNDIPNIEVFR